MGIFRGCFLLILFVVVRTEAAEPVGSATVLTREQNGDYILEMPCRKDTEAEAKGTGYGEVFNKFLSNLTGASKTNFEADQKRKLAGSFGGLRGCKDGKDSNNKPVMGVMPKVRGLLKDRVYTQVESFYNGCVFDPSNPMASGCQGQSAKVPVCNPFHEPGVPSLFGSAEGETNHIGQSCGSWTTFRTQMAGRYCNITPDMSNPNRRENNYTQGAWVQAMNCYYGQVDNELREGKLRLTSAAAVNTATGPCATMANDFKKLWVDNAEKFNGLTSNKSLAEVENCTGQEKAASVEVGSNRLLACDLVAARTLLEATYTGLAYCEVVTRASRSVEQFMADAVTVGKVSEIAANAINGTSSKDYGKCSPTRVLNEHYLPVYQPLLASKGRDLWNASTCGASPESVVATHADAERSIAMVSGKSANCANDPSLGPQLVTKVSCAKPTSTDVCPKSWEYISGESSGPFRASVDDPKTKEAALYSEFSLCPKISVDESTTGGGRDGDTTITTKKDYYEYHVVNSQCLNICVAPGEEGWLRDSVNKSRSNLGEKE